MCKVKKTISLSSHILDKAEVERERLGLDLSGYISVLIATGNVNNGTPSYAPPMVDITKPRPLFNFDDEDDDDEDLERKKSKIDFMLDMDDEEEEEE